MLKLRLFFTSVVILTSFNLISAESTLKSSTLEQLRLELWYSGISFKEQKTDDPKAVPEELLVAVMKSLK